MLVFGAKALKSHRINLFKQTELFDQITLKSQIMHLFCVHFIHSIIIYAFFVGQCNN